jgi:hypothetical protein
MVIMSRVFSHIIVSVVLLLVIVFIIYHVLIAPAPVDNITNGSVYNNNSSSLRAHPYLLFSNISQVPGWQNNGSQPWSSDEASIISNANSLLSYNWLTSGDDVATRACNARYLGLAYQITKNQTYANAAAQGLLSCDINSGVTPGGTDYYYAWGDMYFALTYDWIQPALSASMDAACRNHLAALTNTTYYTIDVDMPNPYYVDPEDFQGRIDPAVAVAGMALYGYTNPSLKSTDAMWLQDGAHNLWVNDATRPAYGRGLMTFSVDSGGMLFNPSYEFYDVMFQITYGYAYNNFYGSNYLSDYPLADAMLTNELWSTYPNGYDTDLVTGGPEVDQWLPYVYGLVNTTQKQEIEYYDNLAFGNMNAGLLPYAEYQSPDPYGGNDIFDYLFDYPETVTPASLSQKDSFNSGVYQVMRDGTDWGSLETYDTLNGSWSNRDQAHDDELALEYYSHSDLVLSDGGEPKNLLIPEGVSPGEYYGMYAQFHNVLTFDDSNSSFGMDTETGSTARGVAKGTVGPGVQGSIFNLVNVSSTLSAPWVSAINTSMYITQLEANNSWGVGQSVTPINWDRQVLMNGNMMVVDDTTSSSALWNYRTLWHPNSFIVTPTGSSTGNVNVVLKVNNMTENWLSLPSATDVDTGIITGLVEYNTTNPYGTPLTTDIYTAPASDVIINNYYARTGGYNLQNDVMAPIVEFKTDATHNMYRTTLITTRNATDPTPSFDTLNVVGTGNAVSMTNGTDVWTSYTGTGMSTFNGYTTDADSALIHTNSTASGYTLTNVSTLSRGSSIINCTGRLVAITAQFNNTEGDVLINTTSQQTVSINMGGLVTGVMIDGSAYAGYETNGQTVSLAAQPGSHLYTLYLNGSPAQDQQLP